MRRKLVGAIVVVGIVTIITFVVVSIFSSFTPNDIMTNQHPHGMRLEDLSKTLANYTGSISVITLHIEGTPETLSLPSDAALLNVTQITDSQGNIKEFAVSLKPDQTDFYHQVGFFNRTADTVVIYPIFTQAAYDINGFYDYYNKKCSSKCLVTNIPTNIIPDYDSSGRAYALLYLLHYDVVTDVDVDQNPSILKKYSKVIVLHNEYVTQKEFDAITSFPNVIYLYPNALYAKITVNYTSNTISLIRGHGYPDPSIGNGFDWKLDNSNYEYDIACDNWDFNKVDNGKMLNCYPSFRMYFDKDLLYAIKN